MKQMMLDMMLQMMPFMKSIVYVGGALLALGIIMVVIRMISGSGRPVVRLAGNGLVVLGIFFLACQGAGMWLNMTPQINFADPTKFKFNLYEFWQIGAALLVAGIVLRLFSGRPADA